MSLIQLPVHDDDLPILVSESEINLAPIVPTFWKCRGQVWGTLGAFSMGTVFGWAAPAIDDMISDSVKFDEAAMASLFFIGALISGPISGYGMLKYGRKYCMLISAIILSVSWLLLGLAKVVLKSSNSGAVTMMYAGRILTGFAGAASLAIAPVYVKEICCDELRTKLGGMVPMLLITGNLYGYVVGSFISWYALSFSCIIFPALQSVLIIWLPESPRCLINKGRNEEGEKSMLWYYQGFEIEEGERAFKQLKRAIDFMKDPTSVKNVEPKHETRAESVKFTSREVLHPLIVSVLLIFFQQFSGISLITIYTTDIFKASGGLVSPKAGTIVVGVSLVLFVVGTIVFLDGCGRKRLLQIGTLMKGICLFALGTYFILKEKKSSAAEQLRWIPVLSVVIYVSAYSLGMGSVPWTLTTEINHPACREISNTLTFTTYWLIAFVVTASLPALRNLIGYHACFFFYGTSCFISFVFVTFCIYETKGKTNEEIMAHYRGSTMYIEEDDDAKAKQAKSLGSITPAKNTSNTESAHGGRDSIVSTDTGGSEMKILYEDETGDASNASKL